MKVGVIGAGPAGLACAYQLVKAGVKTDVYEAGGAVGGLARSFSLWNQTVDLGPHRFFSKDPRVNKLWLEVVGRDYSMVDRLTRILYKKKLYQYPLKPVDVVGKLGAVETARLMLELHREKNLSLKHPERGRRPSRAGSSGGSGGGYTRYFSKPTARSCGVSRAASSTPTSRSRGLRSSLYMKL